MTHRPHLLPALVVLLLAACGGGSTTASTPTPRPAATPIATPTPIATVDPLALAGLFEGTYAGTWNNTTFGTTGSVMLQNKLDRAASTMTSTLTLGGNVFGSPAPPPETFTIKLGSGTLDYSGHSNTFGDLTVQLTPPTFTMKGTNMTSPNVSAFEAHGTVTDPKTLSLDYTATLRAGGTATGKVSLTKS